MHRTPYGFFPAGAGAKRRKGKRGMNIIHTGTEFMFVDDKFLDIYDNHPLPFGWVVIADNRIKEQPK